MSEEKKDSDNVIKINSSHLWNGVWAAVILLLGLGLHGFVDSRIEQHPRVTETYALVKEERKSIERIDKTVTKLEALLERNEELLKELLKKARGE